ncbi:MAG: DUF1549 domain-containing protein [Bacteroidales bacterium]|nr:DUF1549 domain-containing protein [Bacteroidales bacterium]
MFTHRTRSPWRWTRLLGLLAVAGLLTVSPAQAAERPVSFTNDVVPIFTKVGCNLGSCHAKANGGRNGFELSLLGFEPREDYEHIILEARGRRVMFENPDKSLLLLKGSGQISHGGGTRIPLNSENYATIRDWIRQGARMDGPQLAHLVDLEVTPTHGTLARRATQQLQAIARYSDGTRRDVTKLALFESNDAAMAEVSSGGLVKILELPGRVAVMVRFQGRVAVFNAAVPLGAAVTTLPPARNFVDEAVFSNLKELGIPPAPVCDDATFLRRVTLDIAGRLPTLAETDAFLADTSSDKRDRWIDNLLQSPDYADFFANKWAAVLKNRRDTAGDLDSNFAFYAWIRDSLLANKPYDQFVRELLGATGTVEDNPPVAWYKRVKDPKTQIEDIAQLFLGVRMQCAQCHHHPFERWSQDDYYAFAAFFSQVGRKPSGKQNEDLIFHKRGLATATNIKTQAALTPAALGDPMAPITPGEDPRLKLADWMGSPKNPFFAKALVNRYWKHFFQRGLIEPEDDIRDSNPPSNPELLAALEKQFITSGFDLKALVRVITRSNAYQLSSVPNAENLGDHQNYSRYYPRRLQAEMLLDAIDHLAGTRTDFANLPPGTRAIALPDNSYNRSSTFLRVFGRPEAQSVCECERVQTSSLAQSLHLLNAGDLRAKLAHPTGRAAQLAKDTRPLDARVRELYRIAFAREPRPDELKTALAYLTEPLTTATGQKIPEPQALRENLQDLLWALMTTKEFLFNH